MDEIFRTPHEYGDPLNRLWYPDLYREDAVHGVDYEIGAESWIAEDGVPTIRLQRVPCR